MLKRVRLIIGKLLTTQVAWPVLLAIALLCLVSVLALNTLPSPPGAAKPGALQERHILLGSLVLMLVVIPHYAWFGRFSYPAAAIIGALLAAVLLTPAIKGSHRWFVLPGDLQLQPSELAKIAFVLSLAWYLRHSRNYRILSGLIGPFLLMLIPMGLILVEPDLGTALLFPLVLYAMLIAAGARLRHLFAIAFIVLVCLPGLYPMLQPYQRDRIKNLIVRVTTHDPQDPAIRSQLRGDSYQPHLSQIAIGAGGLFGARPEDQATVLPPEAHTDFIFAVIGNRWGFVGCGLVALLYLAFFGAALEIAGSTKDEFGRLVAVGVASMILFQAFINIAMTTGLGPVVGIGLPFVSYGGSSLVTNMLAAGLLLNVSVRRDVKVTIAAREHVSA